MLPEVLKPKRVGYPLSDAQILQLLDNLPEGDPHNQWRFALQLCAVYGLRPEELRHLRIKSGASGSELWTIYCKSMGGTKGAKTEPRRLHPLLLRDADGTAIDWNLQARLEVGEKLPPLNREGDGGQALNQYLRRREMWMALREEDRPLPLVGAYAVVFCVVQPSAHPCQQLIHQHQHILQLQLSGVS